MAWLLKAQEKKENKQKKHIRLVRSSRVKRQPIFIKLQFHQSNYVHLVYIDVAILHREFKTKAAREAKCNLLANMVFAESCTI